MVRAIRFLAVLPLLVISGNAPGHVEIAEANRIANWPAPAFWTPPAARAPRGARTDAVNPALPPLPFVALNPCRVADTRGNGFTGAYGPPALVADATRDFVIAGQCGIPSTAAAVSFNFAALNVSAAGDLRVSPSGSGPPPVSTLNYNGNTPNIANAAVVALVSGAITVQADATSIDLVIDVNGYYDGSGSLQLSLSRRAALDQFWTPQNTGVLGRTTVGAGPYGVRSDGADLWVANSPDGTVSRVRGSDGKLLETWTGVPYAFAVLVAMGKVFVVAQTGPPPPGGPGSLYRIDPSQAAGAATMVASGLGVSPQAMAFDGARIWTANGDGSVSIVTPSATLPWSVTTVTAGFVRLGGILYDGTNIWVTDYGAGNLLKLDGNGAILQTVVVGSGPSLPAFDGTNIWVPNLLSNSVSVVRASDGVVRALLTGNGLFSPIAAAFDGQRVLVVHTFASLWKAADLTPLGSFAMSAESINGVCSDGVNFWISFTNTNQLARF